MQNNNRLFNGKSHPVCPQCGQRLHLMDLEEIFELLRGDEPELERVLGSAHAWRCRTCAEGVALWTDEELLVHFHPNEARVLRRIEEEEADIIIHHRADGPPVERDYDADAYMNWFGDSEDEEDEDLLESGFVILEDLVDEPEDDGEENAPH
jgi:hypothetical protein